MNNMFLKISNSCAILREEIPHLSFSDFRENILDIVKNGGKVVHYFVYKARDTIKLVAVLRTDKLFVTWTDAPDEYTSFTNNC